MKNVKLTDSEYRRLQLAIELAIEYEKSAIDCVTDPEWRVDKAWRASAARSKADLDKFRRLLKKLATPSVGEQLVQGMEQLSKHLKSGKPIKATRVRRTAGGTFKRTKVTLRTKTK